MCTFNDIPDMLDTLSTMMQSMSSEISSLRTELASVKAQLEHKQSAPTEALICGIFRPGEIVHMSDSRLWDGVGAPFTSRDTCRDSRKYGCLWLSAASGRDYTIQAEELRDWILCRDMRKKLTSAKR